MPALLLAVFILTAAAMEVEAGEPACPPEDRGCAAFVGDAGRPDSLQDGPKQPVLIGSRVYMLTPREAERERRCLALAGWAEARRHGPEAMAAVMWVVANRAASERKPSTPCEVVVAPGQFEPFSLRKATTARKAVRGEKAKEDPQRAKDPAVEARRLAAEIRKRARVIKEGGMPAWIEPRLAADREMLRAARVLAWHLNDEVLPDPTRRALMFFSPPVQAWLGRKVPDWAEKRLQTAFVGDHAFFRTPAQVRPLEPQVAQMGE